MIDGFGRPQSALVLGGSSDLAHAAMRRLVDGPCRRVVLAGRASAALDEVAADLRSRGAAVDIVAFDATRSDDRRRVITDSKALLGDIDLVLVAFAGLGPPFDLDLDPEEAAELVELNLAAPIAVGMQAARTLRDQGHGTLVVISSAAAVRPRPTNLIYGSSKAGLDGFATGLGDALIGSGARVMVVRPGFVPTKMTEGRAPTPLATTADAVGRAIERGLARRSRTVWVPAALRPAAAVIRLLPAPLWRRVSSR